MTISSQSELPFFLYAIRHILKHQIFDSGFGDFCKLFSYINSWAIFLYARYIKYHPVTTGINESPPVQLEIVNPSPKADLY